MFNFAAFATKWRHHDEIWRQTPYGMFLYVFFMYPQCRLLFKPTGMVQLEDMVRSATQL